MKFNVDILLNIKVGHVRMGIGVKNMITLIIPDFFPGNHDNPILQKKRDFKKYEKSKYLTPLRNFKLRFPQTSAAGFTYTDVDAVKQF